MVKHIGQRPAPVKRLFYFLSNFFWAWRAAQTVPNICHPMREAHLPRAALDFIAARSWLGDTRPRARILPSNSARHLLALAPHPKGCYQIPVANALRGRYTARYTGLGCVANLFKGLYILTYIRPASSCVRGRTIYKRARAHERLYIFIPYSVKMYKYLINMIFIVYSNFTLPLQRKEFVFLVFFRGVFNA